MTDFLEQKKQEIHARLDELRPLIEEYDRLQAAARALDGLSTVSAKRGSKASASSGNRGRGRPKGSGTRGAEALALITSQPGISISEIAQTMGIQQNYLYRIVPGLEQDGLVEKRGRGWFPKEAA